MLSLGRARSGFLQEWSHRAARQLRVSDVFVSLDSFLLLSGNLLPIINVPMDYSFSVLTFLER